MRDAPVPLPARERTGDEVSADRFRLIADKVEADPNLLEIPLANIESGLTKGNPPPPAAGSKDGEP